MDLVLLIKQGMSKLILLQYDINDLDNYKNIVINNDVITYPPYEAVGQFQLDCLHAALVHLDKWINRRV